MSSPSLPFTHRFKPAGRADLAPLLLLHGTGGDETDLLTLGEMVSPEAALLSPRGQVFENGMPRFFRRFAEGVFDETDVRRRASDLSGFVSEARLKYGIAAPIALGFSNGANIAAAVLMLHPGALAGAILLRAMPPLSQAPENEIAGAPVLILSGRSDPIAPPETAELLAAMLRRAGADVRHETVPAGHGLTREDIARAKSWLAPQSVRQPFEQAASSTFVTRSN
jgi:phospholipase/carboxylesterase